MFNKKNNSSKKSGFVFLNNSKISINPDKVVYLKSNGENLTLFLESGYVEEINDKEDIKILIEVFEEY